MKPIIGSTVRAVINSENHSIDAVEVKGTRRYKGRVIYILKDRQGKTRLARILKYRCEKILYCIDVQEAA